jgi:hypothetical protein
MKVMPGRQKRLRAHIHDFAIVGAGSGARKAAAKQQSVAIPLI